MDEDEIIKIVGQAIEKSPFIKQIVITLDEFKDSINKIENQTTEMNLNLLKLMELQNSILTKQNQNQNTSNVDSEKIIFEDMKVQFDKIDKSLIKFFQKFILDNKKLYEKLNTIEQDLSKPSIVQPERSVVKSPVSKPSKIPPLKRQVIEKEPLIDVSEDKQIINDLKVFFKGEKLIYTTGAIKMVEDTRDKLLFDRETEAPYRAFAAKIFREILSIVKQERDFSSLSTAAISDVQHRLDLLIKRI